MDNSKMQLSDAEIALRDAALEYHRAPTRGKISVTPTKPLFEPARPVARLLARRRLPVPRDRGRPGPGGRVHLARQPGRRHHQRHRGARPRRHRPARRQAGDGRQGLPVQEVRRHRRVRHRARREGPRQAGRHHRRARADARRHQPRGHQGARVLLHREEAARADEHPGLPRRPARHRDHLRRRRCSTASSSSARRSATSSSRVSGAGAAAIACLDVMVGLGVQAREHLRRRLARA